MKGNPTRCRRPDSAGQAVPRVQESGPAIPVERAAGFVPHRHGRSWYLCDRAYVGGRRQHLIRGHCGKTRPTLHPLRITSGLVEQLLPAQSAASFDLVYLDPPYGLTQAEWDEAPNWGWLGAEVARVLKPTGQLVFHGQGIMAARAAVAFEEALAYRFEVVWIKSAEPDDPLHTSILHGPAPMHAHELIHVFRRLDARVDSLTYNSAAMHRRGTPHGQFVRTGSVPQWGWKRIPEAGFDSGWRNPADVVFSAPTRSGQLFAQKPIDLVRYLLLLLTNPGDLILDPYAGSGTTLIAAYGLGRRCFGIEASPRSWKLLKKNLQVAQDPVQGRNAGSGSGGIRRRGPLTRIPGDALEVRPG
jgi:site-specific DNA-methyltransferase (adenine-specific)